MTLRIAPGLDLPDDAVTQAIAILARRGAGKTHTASVVVEEVVKAGLPVVVLDPTGAWWGLRSSADGESAGLPVVILGGEHGDVRLEETAGTVIANVVVDHPGAYVLDLSGFPSNASQDRFVADFLERLYRAKAGHREALLLVVDEADAFAPQRTGQGGMGPRLLGAMEAIVRRGRIRGIGCLLISQRAAVINKSVLTQVEVLIAMQTTGPQDRDAIDDWVKGNGTPEQRAEVIGSLASLQQGEAWVWSPQWLRILQRVRIRRRETFDSSKTPEAGTSAIAPRAVAAVDLAALGDRIAATVEKAKAHDPKALRARITELEREVAAKPRMPDAVTEYVEVPVITDEQRQELVDAWLNGTAAAARIEEAVEAITAELRRIAAPTREEGSTMRPGGTTATPVQKAPARPSTPSDSGTTGRPADAGSLSEAASGVVVRSRPDAASTLGKAERTILGALVAWHPTGLTKVQLSLVTEYSRTSSSFSNALGRLRSSGLVEKAGEPIRATPEGIAEVGDVERPPQPGVELVEYWRRRLGKAESTLLGALVDLYPGTAERQQLADITGYSATSSSFSNGLGRLRSLGLVDGWRASAWVMGDAS